MDGHCLSPYTCKRCIVFKQFDGLNFDGLAGKPSKTSKLPLSKFCAIVYSTRIILLQITHRYVHTDTDTQTQTDRQTDTHIHTHTHTHKQTHRHTDIHRHTRAHVRAPRPIMPA